LNGTSGGTIENEGYVWGVKIKNTDKLLTLHASVMDIMNKYSSSDFDEDSFADKGQGIERAFKWMNGFPIHSAYEKFRPHITIGFGEEQKVDSLEFTASSLAICQLGAYCTCKKILKRIKLN
jgi:hypothetical protein